MMAKINMLNSWSGSSTFFGRTSAQGYLNAGKGSVAVNGSCGSSCGAGDDNKDPKPSACGSACGAGDK